MNDNLLILGAGQYGTVIKELARDIHCFNRIDFLDDNNDKAIGRLEDYRKLVGEYPYAVVAMGNSELRLAWLERLKQAGFSLPILIHPKAYVSPSAKLGEGTFLEPMAVVQAGAVVKNGVIVCAGAVVNHNATIEQGCQIDCNAVVAANAVVSACTKVPCGSVVLSQIKK